MRVEVIKSFASAEEIKALNDWAEEGVRKQWLDIGVTNRTVPYQLRLTSRFYGHRFEYPDIAHAIHRRIRQTVGFPTAPIVHGHGRNGIVVSYTKVGGNTYEHKDMRMYPELATLRLNIITQEAEEGGELFVGGQKIDVKAGDLHCYLASEHSHYVTEVKGSKPRILWMFGACVPQEQWE